VPKAKFDHYLASLEGLALSRHWLIGDSAEAEARYAALRELLVDAGPSLEFEVREQVSSEAYARWAATYDRMPNPLIAVEQPTVHGLIREIEPGTAVDAACGSGRHTAWLRECGFHVIGVDESPEMLELARAKASDAELRSGRLEALPIDSEAADLTLCCLALTHCRELDPAIGELARITRRGGRLILSDLHPVLGLLGNTALFLDAKGRPGVAESHVHLHSDYLAAFAQHGLEVLRCIEPRYGRESLPALTGPMPPRSHAAIEAGMLGLPGALVWLLRRS